MHAVTKLTLAQFKLYLREPIALFFTLIFPAMLILTFGAIWGNEPFPGIAYGYIDLQVPATAAVIIGTIAFNAIPVMTATNRERRILRRFKASPLPTSSYMAADIIVNFALGLLSMVLLVLLARVVFGLRFAGNPLLVLAGFTLSALAFMAVGYLIASLAPTARMAQIAGQIVYFPMIFISGATIPLSQMPADVRAVAQWLPMTHIVDLLQSLWLGGDWPLTPTLVLLATLLAATLLSVRLFRWE